MAKAKKTAKKVPVKKKKTGSGKPDPTFDPESAHHAIDFIEKLCTHTKGIWAGKPFRLIKWQRDLIKELFGRIDPSTGRRQYRICYVEIPKKNGKTELAAAISLLLLCGDHEQGGEIYSAAADRGQASLTFNVAAQMVRNSRRLSKRLKVLDSLKRIVDYKSGSFYQVLSSEAFTKHGLNPSGVLFDELHSQPNDDLWDVLTSGTDYAREQQLIFVTSTAGVWNPNSIWWRVREKARQVKKGVVKDPRFLPILFIANKDKDNPADERVWARVNPSLGEIFTIDKIRADWEAVKNHPVERQSFLRFRLNIPVASVSRWLSMEKYDACSGAIRPDDLVGRICFGGLDLSTRIDLSAFVLVFPPDEAIPDWLIVPKFYVPADTVIERGRGDRVSYSSWVDAGLIRATEGSSIDYAYIEHDIVEASKLYRLGAVGFDPWGATELSSRLINEHSIEMITLKQGWATFSEVCKDFQAKVLSRCVRHGGNPVLRWNFDNLVMKNGENGDIRPIKDKSSERIDGAVATFLGWKCATMSPDSRSIYEERGVVVL